MNRGERAVLFEHGLNVSWGVFVMWTAGGLTFACLGFAWRTDEPFLGQVGLACLIIAAALSVIQDNAKTRRVVRAVLREHQERVRSV